MQRFILITYVNLIQEETKTTWCLAFGKLAGSYARICVMTKMLFSSLWSLGFCSGMAIPVIVFFLGHIHKNFGKYRI